jgi:hypothetical protein
MSFGSIKVLASFSVQDMKQLKQDMRKLSEDSEKYTEGFQHVLKFSICPGRI